MTTGSHIQSFLFKRRVVLTVAFPYGRRRRRKRRQHILKFTFDFFIWLQKFDLGEAHPWDLEFEVGFSLTMRENSTCNVSDVVYSVVVKITF